MIQRKGSVRDGGCSCLAASVGNADNDYSADMDDI